MEDLIVAAIMGYNPEDPLTQYIGRRMRGEEELSDKVQDDRSVTAAPIPHNPNKLSDKVKHAGKVPPNVPYNPNKVSDKVKHAGGVPPNVPYNPNKVSDKVKRAGEVPPDVPYNPNAFGGSRTAPESAQGISMKDLRDAFRPDGLEGEVIGLEGEVIEGEVIDADYTVVSEGEKGDSYMKKALGAAGQALKTGAKYAGLFVLGTVVAAGSVLYAKTADAGSQVYEEALSVAKKGNELWISSNYVDAIPALKKAVVLWEKVPQKERYGNYGATLTGLAGSIVHHTIRTDKDEYKLREGLNIAEKAVQDFEYCKKIDKESASTCHRLSSGAFNIMGLANKYLGRKDVAKKCYEKAINRNPSNEDAKYNLSKLHD
jgi:hypothetical protein